MTQTTVGIRELKSRLSHYLRLVKGGRDFAHHRAEATHRAHCPGELSTRGQAPDNGRSRIGLME